MNTGEIEKKIRYAEDKPSDCRHCYWWYVAEERCILGEDKCYYILPEKQIKKSSLCDGCPYGKNAPCIGYCLRKIMNKDGGGDGHEQGR